MEKFAENRKNFSNIWSIKATFGQNRCPIIGRSEACRNILEKILRGGYEKHYLVQ